MNLNQREKHLNIRKPATWRTKLASFFQSRKPNPSPDESAAATNTSNIWSAARPVVEKGPTNVTWSIVLPEPHSSSIKVYAHPNCFSIRILKSSADKSPLNVLQRALPRADFMIGEPEVLLTPGKLVLNFSSTNESNKTCTLPSYKWLNPNQEPHSEHLVAFPSK